MATYLIPIPSSVSQIFSIRLAGNNYFFTLIFRNAPASEGLDSAGWFLDIKDSTGSPVIQGIALVPESNLLSQYDYFQLGFALYLQSDGSTYGNPGYNDLGVHFFLYAIY